MSVHLPFNFHSLSYLLDSQFSRSGILTHWFVGCFFFFYFNNYLSLACSWYQQMKAIVELIWLTNFIPNRPVIFFCSQLIEEAKIKSSYILSFLIFVPNTYVSILSFNPHGIYNNKSFPYSARAKTG